jgi:hypothetical protein
VIAHVTQRLVFNLFLRGKVLQARDHLGRARIGLLKHAGKGAGR